MKTNMVQ